MPWLAPIWAMQVAESQQQMAERRLFDAQVACAVAARMQVVGAPTSPQQQVQAERVLRDLAIIEERGRDDADAHENKALQRVEAQLDLMTTLLGAVLAERGHAVSEVAVRLSATGVSFAQAGSASLPDLASLIWQPSDLVPVTVQLPVKRLAEEGSRGWWAFHDLPASLADRVARHVFRLHRRELAQQRRNT